MLLLWACSSAHPTGMRQMQMSLLLSWDVASLVTAGGSGSRASKDMNALRSELLPMRDRSQGINSSSPYLLRTFWTPSSLIQPP